MRITKGLLFPISADSYAQVLFVFIPILCVSVITACVVIWTRRKRETGRRLPRLKISAYLIVSPVTLLLIVLSVPQPPPPLRHRDFTVVKVSHLPTPPWGKTVTRSHSVRATSVHTCQRATESQALGKQKLWKNPHI